MTSTKMKDTSASRGAGPLVLIVDDFEDNRAMYLEYLEYHGFQVAEAVNGEEAVERTIALQPALVVMDLSLPVMDGWEATRRLKANAETRHIVVIALTGHAEASHVDKARAAGCDDFVPKPCLPEDLLAKVREHLGAGGEKAKPAVKARPSASPPKSASKSAKRTSQKGKT